MCNEPRDERPDLVEATLAELRPGPSSIDRGAVMYTAGYAAGRASLERRPALRVWQATACVATAACVALWVARVVAPPGIEPSEPLAAAAVDPPIRFAEPVWDLTGPLTLRPSGATAATERVDAPSGVGVDTPRSMRALLDELLKDQNRGDEA